MSNHTIPPLVISSTNFAAFKRCRKSFEYAEARKLNVPSSEAAQLGTSLHELLALAARGDRKEIEKLKDEPMYPIALEYLRHRGLPGKTLLIEEPLYTLVIPEEKHWGEDSRGNPAELLYPAVYIRTTFDRVFVEDDARWLVARDYKSFDTKPTLYVDLDFQGRMQTAALQKAFKVDTVRFEWEYIRREIGRELKGKGYVEWGVEDRYLNVPLISATHELKQIWEETQDVARDLVRCLLVEKRFYREDLKTGPHSCSSCFYKQLCAAEFAQGVLTEDDIEMFTEPADPLWRMTPRGIVSDPRVKYWLDKGESEADAIQRIYGRGGVRLALPNYSSTDADLRRMEYEGAG